jgi:hypothetical protein
MIPGPLLAEYPHHNLYWVLSDEWDLRALQAVLLSAVTRFFVASYSTKMRGGFLRQCGRFLGSRVNGPATACMMLSFILTEA